MRGRPCVPEKVKRLREGGCVSDLQEDFTPGLYALMQWANHTAVKPKPCILGLFASCSLPHPLKEKGFYVQRRATARQKQDEGSKKRKGKKGSTNVNHSGRTDALRSLSWEGVIPESRWGGGVGGDILLVLLFVWRASNLDRSRRRDSTCPRFLIIKCREANQDWANPSYDSPHLLSLTGLARSSDFLVRRKEDTAVTVVPLGMEVVLGDAFVQCIVLLLVMVVAGERCRACLHVHPPFCIIQYSKYSTVCPEPDPDPETQNQ